ncbi:hypothetical protein EP331_15640 [bacterium]|nr:MAG: hypothetical protein EP331_15640 [bacterium]
MNALVFILLLFLFILTAVIVNNKVYKHLSIILIIILQLYFGLSGRTQWPFFNWNLYVRKGNDHIVFNEFRACFENIKLKYDARYIPPTLSTPLGRYAQSFPTWKEQYQNEFVDFLDNGVEVFVNGSINSALQIAKFPRHQLGYKWSPYFEAMGKYVGIELWNCDVRILEDGNITRKDSLIMRLY